MGKVDTSDLMMIITWAMDISMNKAQQKVSPAPKTKNLQDSMCPNNNSPINMMALVLF